MKKIIFTFCLFIVSFISRGQTSMYSEDFDTIPYTAHDVPSTGPGWADDPTLFTSGSNSFHATISAVGDTNILETDGFFDLNGFGFITLSFSHIAKVDFFDRCILEYSVDFGATWTRIDNTNSTYLGSTAGGSLTWPSFFSYMAPSYPLWDPTHPDSIPHNDWWVTETFDMSISWPFQPEIRIRFKMYDGNGNGGSLNYGWNIDDINVLGAYCELTAPTMSQVGGLSGAVYGGGPYNISYNSVDGSGILDSTGYVVYTITDSLGNTYGPDSVVLGTVGGNVFTGTIPTTYNSNQDTIAPGDTICYYAYTVDNSGCFNTAYVPSAGGCTSFYYATAVGFPYCNSFDNVPDTTWSVNTVSGSAWEQGLPTTPPTNTTYNGAACWDVDLANIYQNGTDASLYSPLFAWSGTDVKLSFYQNRDVESGWDGVVLLCDTAGSGNWFQIGTFPPDPNLTTNWYSTDFIQSGDPAYTGFWDGNSNGWQYSEIVLTQLNAFASTPGNKSVQFRFQFTSDASVQLTGFSIDQFCLKLPQVYDVGVLNIIEPQPEAPAGDTAYVQVRIKNYGITPMTAGSFDVQYFTPISGYSGAVPYTGATIPPNLTDTFTIPVPFVIPEGLYDICAWTELATDGDHTNDSLCASRLGVATFQAPYCDDFDSAVYWNGVSLLNGTTVWELGTPNFGSITTAHSAPNAWKTNLNSAYDNNADAELRSPYFDFLPPTTFNSVLSFWMNRNIQSNSDELILEFSLDFGQTWTTLGVPNGGTNWYNNPTASPGFNGPGWDGNSGGWIRCDYPVGILNGMPHVRFRFRFLSDFFGTAEGAAIDDFCIKPPVPDDPGIKRVISPGPLETAGASLVPTVVIKNYGSNVLTSIPVSYRIGGIGPLTSGIFNGSLNPGDSVNFNTWAAFTVPTCAFTFEAFTEFVGDGDMTNDSSGVLNVVGLPKYVLPVSGPTCENFDSASCWSATPSPQGSSKWELGTPNFGVTTGAFSPPNAWDVNLNTAYDNNAETYLYTAKYDFTNAVNATMSFMHNWQTETGWDGVRVEYSISSGPWTILGVNSLGNNSNGDGINWYNEDIINSSPGPCWDNGSLAVFGTQWVKSSHNLSIFDNQGDVQFRFVFTSDGSVTQDGHSIDDFCIRTPYPHDIGVSQIIRPGPLEGAGNILAPQVEIKNYGSSTETTSPITYVLDNQAPVTFVWAGSLAPNATTIVTLPTDTVPAGAFPFCAWTELPGDGDLSNDSLCGSSFGVAVVIPTYTDNFDTGAVNFVNVPGGSGFTNWELGSPNFGQTNSVHSAPNCWDVNLNITYGNNDSCFLYTPIFNLSNKKAPVFRFWHNYNLDNFNGDGVYVQYSINGGTNWNLVPTPGPFPYSLNWYNSANLFASGTPGWNGNSGGWVFCYATLDTNIFNGAPGSQAQFRFVFKSDGFTQIDGFSVDDFQLFIPTALTISPQEIKPVNKLVTPGPQYITAKIRNKGTNTVNTANVTLVVDGDTIVTDAVSFAPALQGASYAVPGNFNIHTFSIPWNASPGAHDVCVWTDTPNGFADQDLTDDTICTVITVFDSVTVTGGSPYCTDFESGPQWVSLNAITYAPPNNWQVGLPGKTCLNSAHSGGNAWSTLLNANYPNRDTSALFTPVFNVNPAKCYKLSFWHKYDTEQFQDGGNVEYSIDSGNTWFLLGFGGEPNWYNSVFVTGLGGTPPRGGFSGSNCTWTQSTHEYSPFGTTVIFRFHFGSDFSFNKEGWEIDDVCFEELPASCTVGIVDPGALAGLDLGQNYPNPATNQTSFDYSLPDNGQVLIELTDIMGQVVMTPVNGNMQAGTHTVSVNSASITPGIYFYTLKFDNHMLVKKMVITK